MSSSNGYATRDDFFAAPERRFTDTTSRLLGKKVRIRSMTEGEWAAVDIGNWDLEKGGQSESGIKSSNVRLMLATIVDGNDTPIFTDTDGPRLERVDSAIIEPLVREIRAHCGLRGDVEDSVKNLDGTGGGDSPCSSVELSTPATV
jgi:hypothetical protein